MALVAPDRLEALRAAKEYAGAGERAVSTLQRALGLDASLLMTDEAGQLVLGRYIIAARDFARSMATFDGSPVSAGAVAEAATAYQKAYATMTKALEAAVARQVFGREPEPAA